jgi:hypothetical protein
VPNQTAMLRERSIRALRTVGLALFANLFSAVSFAEKAPTTFAQPAPISLPAPEWRKEFPGISYASFSLTSPRAMTIHALRIETQTPGLAFFATPGLPTPRKAREETAGVRTSSFLQAHGLQAAINAAPYGPQHASEGLPQDVAGLHVSNGDVVSTQIKTYPALVISKKNRARIVNPPFSTDDVYTAVGGFNIVLRDGNVLDFPRADLHPRTAIGIDRTSDTMWWIVIDGRQPGFSEGASLRDVAEVLRALGASDGINLDGGGTSTMVVADEHSKPRVLNRPIHSGIPGNERIAASHLGVFSGVRGVGPKRSAEPLTINERN